MRKKEFHGMVGTSVYQCWASMRMRCLNNKNPRFKNYGGRGITVCDEWKNSFVSFYNDMGDMGAGMSLDRIDNNKGYYKGNCRWATKSEQQRNINTQKNNKVGFKGVYFCNTYNKYVSKLYCNGKTYHLGYFDDLNSAIKARKEAELKYWK
tara:strand:+ start:103 stop:555 length:453 start_codon:yes stop_codon:yes gene_type:complete